MERNDIELLIDKKVAEAKLEVTEKRLKFVIGIAGAMLAFFGVFVPIWQTNKASDKVDSALTQMKQDIKYSSQDLRSDSRASSDSLDKSMSSIRADVRADIDSQSRQLSNTANGVDSAIHDMQKQFKELAGTQLRKPALEGLCRGVSLDGGVLKFSPSVDTETVDIKNVGDAPARNIRIRLYSTFGGNCQNMNLGRWSSIPISDEPNYRCAFEILEHQTIDAKEFRSYEIYLENGFTPGNYPSLLKIFYEQPEPRKFTFTINFSGSK